MNLHPFSQAYYEVLEKIEDMHEVESSVDQITRYLSQLIKTLTSLGINKELIEYLIYALAAIADHFILNHLSNNKDISGNRIFSCSVEVNLFQSAESGQKLSNNIEKILLIEKNENIINLIKIYLYALGIVDDKNKALLKQIQEAAYPLNLKKTDLFNCKKRPIMNSIMKRFIYTKWLLFSLSSSYIILSTLSWYTAAADLRSSIYRFNQLSCIN